jgi:4-carboxymuconolactone decarboxylase
MTRRPPAEPPDYSAEQVRLRDMIIDGPRKKFSGPFPIWIASPEGFGAVESFATFVRYGSSLEPRLRELVILLVARHWNCAYEWSAHSEHALDAGVPESVVAALAAGRTPDGLVPRFQLAREAALALLDRKDIDETLHARLSDEFKNGQLVDLLLTLGYYSTVAMTLNAFQLTPSPPPRIPLQPVRQ